LSAKPLTVAQKRAKALAACKKLVSKRKRVACERQARAKYPPSKAERVAAALKACKVHKRRSQRAACERRARKQFSPKGSASSEQQRSN